jgi:hypothetical protein
LFYSDAENACHELRLEAACFLVVRSLCNPSSARAGVNVGSPWYVYAVAGESGMHLDTDTEEEEQQQVPEQHHQQLHEEQQQQLANAPNGAVAVSLPAAGPATLLGSVSNGIAPTSLQPAAAASKAPAEIQLQSSPKSVSFCVEQPNGDFFSSLAAPPAAAAAGADSDERSSDDAVADLKAWEVKKGHQLQFERVRTMAPDLNRRPADSGTVARYAPDGLGRRGSIFSRSVANLRLASGVFVRSKSIARGMGEQGAAGPGLPSSVSAANVGRLVKAEERAVGGVDWKVYGQYCMQVGLLVCCLLSLALLAGQAVFLAAEWWLALWASSPVDQQGKPRWLSVYGGLTALLVVVSIVRASFFFAFSLRAATKMHNTMIKKVLRAPLSFFHTNPAGRVLNRFSSDQVG